MKEILSLKFRDIILLMKKNTIQQQLNELKNYVDKQEELTNLEKRLLNFCELTVDENENLIKKVQTLSDEIKILKGEQGKPTIRKQTKNKNNDHSSEDNRKKGKRGKPRGKTGSKKAKVKTHQTVNLTMKPEDLPPDAVKHGFKNTIIQDIQIIANNTLFVRQQYHSKSENKYYVTPLPPGYEGEYGPCIKSWSNVMYSSSEITFENITGIFKTAGVIISKPTVHSFIIKTGASLEDEKISIAKAGLQSTSFQHLDDTVAREKGKNRHVNVLGNEHYSVYFTLPHKDRLSIIKMLSLDDFKCVINSFAIDLMKIMDVSDKIIASIEPYVAPKYYHQAEIEKILETVLRGKKQQKARKLVLEAMAIAAYRDSPYAIKQLIVDDAPQFKLITDALGLCWVHEGRHYKKIHPIFKRHKKVTEDFITRFWDYYHSLIDYKKNPSASLAEDLRKEFTEIFSTKTDYEKLDKQITLTLKKIESLLLVLKYPNIPLHNNPAEHMARWQARARDIHLHTMSQAGTQAKDALATISGTAKKLSVNVFHYFYDRITKKYEMPSLADLIPKHEPILDS